MENSAVVIGVFVDKFSGRSFRVGDIYVGNKVRVDELTEAGYLRQEASSDEQVEEVPATPQKQRKAKG
jgi:hypothetical protein